MEAAGSKGWIVIREVRREGLAGGSWRVGVEVGWVALNLAKDDDVAHVVARAVVWVKELGRGGRGRKMQVTGDMGGGGRC